MAHTLVALVQDHPGVLNRAVSLFRRRGFNIESLAVGHSETPGVSRMTIVVEAEDVEQAVKQLYRLVEVIKVSDVTHDPTVEREMALIKVHAPASRRPEIVALAEVFGAKIVDVATSSLIVEITDGPDRVDALLDLLRPYGVKEMTRSGRIAMARGAVLHRAPEPESAESPERLALGA
jgi:acetolactate synthase-1/3 small subunit